MFGTFPAYQLSKLERTMSEKTDTTATSDKIVNRHIARLLTNLELANCPEVYVQAVKSELTWLRSDLKALSEQER